LIYRYNFRTLRARRRGEREKGRRERAKEFGQGI